MQQGFVFRIMDNTISKPKPENEKAIDKIDFNRLAHFRYQLRCFLRASESVCQEHGTTPLQYQLLLQLKGSLEREWATIGELAEQLQSKHHGIVALVDRCEKAELVERRPGRDDRRKVEIHLLPKGHLLVTNIATLLKAERELLKHEFNLLD